MAWRADHNREELHVLALTAARQIVEEDDFRDLTARNVANSIGFSAGTLYKLFDTIDDLVEQVNSGTLDSPFTALRDTPSTGQAITDVADLCTRYHTFLDQNPNLCELLFEYRYVRGYRQKINQGLEIVGAALSSIFPAGHDKDISEAASTLWASLQGVSWPSKNSKLAVIGGQSRDDLAHSLLTDFVVGLHHHSSI